ncbi:MAG: hypothetical protein CBC38_05860 [Gammaproteobacteria bacterium TMED78]|nr:MAG: hypothetical protein CBC38_05860 [Gammaproteobacteria bacterium TMED78]|tara:strand:- start:11512 stop:11817 length:306 start_codon:yes stop_codon:yes gene_type:complete
MPAYWLARSIINNPEGYKKYTDLVPDILKKYGGRVLARGGPQNQLEGNKHFLRHVVVEFPDMKSAEECFNSGEYQRAREYRLNGVGENELIIVDGGDATPK